MTEQCKPGTGSGTIGAYELRRATEAAARAAYAWIGRGDKALADDAAVSAMQAGLDSLNLDGRMLVGEGPADEIGMLYHGQRFGSGTAEPAWDLVVDPLEGTSFLAKGMTNAMAVVAMAPHGSLFDPAPARYMEKLAAPPAAKGKIDPQAPVAERLRQLSGALNKPVEDITVYVIEKPRHKALVQAIHAAGARVALYPAGDVAGALMAAIPGSGIDALMGTGGTPEGLLSAMAIRAMGGEFLGRIDPQLATEAAAVQAAGMDLGRWYLLSEMVRTDDVVFCATGITTGLLLDGVERTRESEKTQTLMIGGAAGPRQMLTSWHHRA
ncbi:fructose 1,6-bisphosphatase II [Paramagnetospirillum caucaseum]|uniref:Fructose-1,6-bisphosphatase n=1 Tax=Paramagnetospirillum caucaseum TaxID=1244869 RepID=M2YFT5_9PROT|nr:class II fructose-bisphosphatase [Paramagnetospirillum caucaseum]EME71956.1 fructose 1,6-bisphosphatase II [Paramagnetospirillum caucaseum]